MTPTANVRQSYCYLRSVCRSFDERMTLGDAIRNGWNAEAITKLAEESRYQYRGSQSKETAYRQAIRKAASRLFVSEEAKNEQHRELEAILAECAARAAIKTTKDNRPIVPDEFKAFLTACRNMEDCDRLNTVIEGGWSASDLLRIAAGFGRGVNGKPTPLSIRLAVSTAGGNPPGQHELLRATKKTNADLHD